MYIPPAVAEICVDVTATTYRARDRGGAASVPRRRRDVDYMLSSGRPRIFVGWCLADRHEKGSPRGASRRSPN